MPDLSQTASSVLPGTDMETVENGLAGETITAGMPVYKNSSDTYFYKALASGTAAQAQVKGLAMNSATAGQPVAVGKKTIYVGATVAVGTMYFLSANAGAICLQTDLSSTNYVTPIGIAATTTTINVLPVISGVQKA